MANNSSRTLKLIFAGENKGAIRSVEGIGKSVGGLQGQLGGLGGALAGVFSAGAITAGLTKATQGWQEQGLAIAQVKRLTGESAENASLMSFAAQQSGIDATKAAVGWRFLAKNIENGKVAAEDIATTDQNGNLLSFQQILGNVADHFKELPPGVERTALALKLFGRGGADMVKVLVRGSAGIEAMRAEMQKYGLEFSDSKLKQVQKYVETQRDLQAVFGGIEVAIGSKVGPKIAGLEELFVRLPGPVRSGAAELTALGVAVGGLVLAVGALGPAMGRGVALIRGKAAAATTATEADVALAEADLSAAEAETTLTAAWAAGTPVSEAAAAARGSLVVADGAVTAAAAAATAAAEAETVAFAAQAAELGALGLAAKGALGAVGAISDQRDPTKSREFYERLKDRLSSDDFVKMADGDVKSLKELKAGAKGYHIEIPELDAAIKRVEESTKRKTKAHEKDNTVMRSAAKIAKDVAAADEELAKSVATATDKAISERDAQQGVIDAHQQRLDDEAALATAQQAAVGNSDDYRQALDDIASAEKDEVSAKADVLSAQEDLNQARVDAAKNLSDLTDATNKAAEAERDSVLAKHEAEAELRKVLADPRSSALDKEKATVGLADAEDNAKQAAKDHTQAIIDENAAKRAGIEGDKDVVAAKGKVKDAQDKVRESIDKVADSQAAARKVLSDAAIEAQADSKKVQADKATEAAAWFELAEQTNDATGAALIYYALLKQMGADPALQALLAAALNGVNTALLAPNGQGELANGRPAPHAPGSPGAAATTTTGSGGGLAGSAITVNLYGDSRQNAKAAAAAVKKVHDDLWRGAR